MKIQINYFGMLADITKCSQQVVDVEQNTVSELLDRLLKQHPMLKGKIFRVVQGKTIVSESSKLDGNEIAFLPPFSGG